MADRPPTSGPAQSQGSDRERSGVLYCGTCGALNPRTNHYCSACGHALVDAYHASEGLRVYLTPDPGAQLVEILDIGADITMLTTDEVLPADFAKVALEDGRVGYVRLREVQALLGTDDTAPTRREAVGCISSTALLAIIALLILGALMFGVIAVQSDDGNADFIAVISCLVLLPFLLLIVGFYFYVSKREREILEDREEELETATEASDGA